MKISKKMRFTSGRPFLGYFEFNNTPSIDFIFDYFLNIRKITLINKQDLSKCRYLIDR
jgi:hypothetical protein